MTRLDDLIAAVEADEPVDLRKVFDLQALDLAAANERFVADHLASQEEADGQIAQRT